MKNTLIASGFLLLFFLSGCAGRTQDEMIIETNKMKSAPMETRYHEEEPESTEPENPPPIDSAAVVFDAEFTYEDSVKGETVVVQFVQNLFSYSPDKVKETLLNLSELTASDKSEHYQRLYREVVDNYSEMTAYNVIVEDYNTRKLMVEGKELNTLEYKVTFNVRDNVYGETEREHLIYVIREGEYLKIFSNRIRE